MFAAAAIWFLEREGELAVSPVVAWFAVAVVIIGGAIILTGAFGRRVGFLGFLATTFIIGWLIGLTVVPRALDFAEDGVAITIDGVRHTIGDDHGWFDDSAGGIQCGSYDLSASDLADATTYVVEPGQESVTVGSRRRRRRGAARRLPFVRVGRNRERFALDRQPGRHVLPRSAPREASTPS